MKEKILIATRLLFMAAVIFMVIAAVFPTNGPPPDQISQVRRQIKSEQMIQ